MAAFSQKKSCHSYVCLNIHAETNEQLFFAALRQIAQINYIYVFLQLQIFSYDEHLVFRNALFYGFPAECQLWHSYV
jgi:hypothetical protein